MRLRTRKRDHPGSGVDRASFDGTAEIQFLPRNVVPRIWDRVYEGSWSPDVSVTRHLSTILEAILKCIIPATIT